LYVLVYSGFVLLPSELLLALGDCGVDFLRVSPASARTFRAATIRSPAERYGDVNVLGDTKWVVSCEKSSLDQLMGAFSRV
jgi:hypothetical protein